PSRLSLRRVRAFLFVVVAACGPKPAGSWVEREAPQRHEHSASQPATATPVKIDLTTLTPATIDALDEATARAVVDQRGDKAPAARVALRAARLAHHEGDDAIARALVARAATAADEHEVHAELVALGGELATVAVDPATIAVLLPLSGRFAAVGSELR